MKMYMNLWCWGGVSGGSDGGGGFNGGEGKGGGERKKREKMKV